MVLIGNQSFSAECAMALFFGQYHRIEYEFQRFFGKNKTLYLALLLILFNSVKVNIIKHYITNKFTSHTLLGLLTSVCVEN